MLIILWTAVATRLKHEQSSFRIKSVFHFKTYTSKISVLTHCQDLNTVLPAIVSAKQMASVQIHKPRQYVLKPFLPALWLVVAAGALEQRRWPQWVIALPPPHPKPSTRGSRHPMVTMALAGPLLKSFCVDKAKTAEINGKAPADASEARTSCGVPGGSRDNSAIASATSGRAGDAKNK